jgi:nucleoid DNA-binding protein
MGTPTEQVTGKKSTQSANILDYPAVVETLARQQKLPEVKVRAIVRGLVALVADGLKNGKAVHIGGLGVLRVREPKAPVAGGSQKVSKRVVLVPAKKFNDAVNLE